MKTRHLLLLMIMVTVAFQAKPSNISDTTALNDTVKSDHYILPSRHPAFNMEASYVADVCLNMSGGIKTGMMFLGMANLKAGFDTQNAGLWAGGQFFINGALTHGQSPSELLTGDFQTVSNIDAGNHLYLHELWFRQMFPGFEITIGLQDLNVEFARSDNGSLFINSSFGIPSVISDNIPVPIFPLTALGITAKVRISNAITFNGALYDGCPTAFDRNEFNIRWHLNRNDGMLLMSELQWTTKLRQLNGIFKAGYYFHSRLAETDEASGTTTEVFKENYGVYLIADQTVWKQEDSERSISMFAQLALSPSSINDHHYYFGGGINYTGFSKKQPGDAIGIALACALFNKYLKKNETTTELYYKKQIGSNFFIQPELQYVINPSGTAWTIPNALIGILRFGMNF